MYEITLLIDPTREKTVEKIRDICQAAGLNYEDAGTKSLSYPLTLNGREYTTARYIYIDTELARPRTVSEILARARWCLRYLIVKKDNRGE